VTERAVFRLCDGKLILTEIAPGVDLQTQVLDQAGFELTVSDDLQTMPVEVFRSEPMGLAQRIGES
jgi:acyl CoA:acetate/3-ketoacid CoA transferase